MCCIIKFKKKIRIKKKKMLTWKIVKVSKVSVIYIYIYRWYDVIEIQQLPSLSHQLINLIELIILI